MNLTKYCCQRCSFVQPENSKEVYDISGGTKPTVWNANCGGSFGHELMFSRTLELDMGVQTHFETAKNARGGTRESLTCTI